jgi:hypothetical protein
VSGTLFGVLLAFVVTSVATLPGHAPEPGEAAKQASRQNAKPGEPMQPRSGIGIAIRQAPSPGGIART